MNIVLTNDDGYLAPGLWAAYDAIQDLGNIIIVAPRSERSASSHAITLRTPITVQRVTDSKADQVYAVDGFPADCVRLAFAEIVQGTIDLVVSGINRGANSGVDTYYSGTVAAAREGAMLGIPSIALSQAIRQEVDTDWALASEVAGEMVRELKEETLAGPGLWSVNMPAPIPANFQDHIHRVPVASNPMPMKFESVDASPDTIAGNEANTKAYRYGVPYWQREATSPSDYETISNGEIAVTAIPVFGRF